MSAETDDPAVVRYLGGRKFIACESFLIFSFVLAVMDKLSWEWGACGGTALAVYTGVNTYLQARRPTP